MASGASATRATEAAEVVEDVLARALPLVKNAVASVGVDVVDIEQFKREIATGGERFLAHIFTTDELWYCGARVERLATRLAAKEAVAKALGTGIRDVDWLDIEVCTEPNGRPLIALTGAAERAASLAALAHVHVSLSHEAGLAVAVAVGDRQLEDKTNGGDQHE